MRRLDTYILRQIGGPFLFFVLVFTGIIWLTQSLRVIDTVVNNGQSAAVFLEFTALLLPMVLAIVLPVSLFAAVLYAINRLYTDSEIVVMFASGLSGRALLRPVLTISLLVMAIVYGITTWAMPTAQREMRDRISQIRGDVAAAFIREGQFLSPVQGVTVYLRASLGDGRMAGVFVHDERDPEAIVTYTAEEAVLLRDDGGTRLVMFNGTAQGAQERVVEEISILRFDRLSYDLTALTEPSGARQRKPSEMFVPELLRITAEEGAPRKLGSYRAEAHEALSGPLYVLALPLLAVAFIISAGFRRQGFVNRIILAVVAGVALRLMGLAAKSVVSAEAALWPTMYLPPVLAIGVALWLLSGGAPRRRRFTEAV